MAQANVEVKVQSQDLDRLKGKLVELQKGLKIQYDINGKPIDIVIDKSLNLQKQIKLLTAELRRTKEGTAEFTLLADKLDDTKDNFERVSAKSKDLFASLSLLPGPVGIFFGQLNGAIGLLKTFSGFSLKDVGDQFKRVAGDIKDIFNNFFGATKEAKSFGDTINASTTLAASSTANAAAAATNYAAAVKNTAGQVQLAAIAYNRQGQAVIMATKKISEMNAVEIEAFNNQKKALMGSDKMKIANQQLAGSYEAAKLSGQKFTVTQEGIVVVNTQVALSARLATAALTAMKIALASLGIGVVLIAVQALFTAIQSAWSALTDWATGAKAAAAENERLSSSYDLLKRSIDETQQAIKDQTDMEIMRAKIAGETEEQIYQVTLKGLDRRIKATEDGRKKIERELELLIINTVLKEEERLKLQQELQDKYVQLGIQFNDLRIERQKMVLSEELRVVEKSRQDLKTSGDKRLNDQKQILNQYVTNVENAYKKIRSLEEENTLALIEDERAREAQQLSFQKKREEDEVNALKLKNRKLTKTEIDELKKKGIEVTDELITGEQIKNRLLEQINIKYSTKVLQNRKKYDQEDFDRIRDYNRKIQDIELEAISNKEERDLRERMIRRDREIQDLEKDKEFVKKSEEEKERIRQLIRQKYANMEAELLKQKQKEQDDERLRKLDEELKFLQIRNEALIEGTKNYFDSQLELLNKSEEREITATKQSDEYKALNKEQQEKRILDIQNKYGKLRDDLYNQQLQQTITVIGNYFGEIGNLAGAIASLYDEEAKKSKEVFEKRKQLQTASAIMSAAQSILSILAAPPAGNVVVDGILKAIRVGVVSIQTAAQVKQIQNTQFEGGSSGGSGPRGYARGGMIEGQRHAQGGVLIEAEGGEAVMTRGAVSMFGPLLSMMNQAGGGTNFNKNLMVTANDAPLRTEPVREQAPTIVKTYVVSNELTTEQEKLARLKNLSTL